MNQRFIAPGLTNIVGATLAVALVNALAVALLKHESGLSAQVMTKKLQHECKQARGDKKSLVQNATDLQHIFYVNKKK